VLAYGGKDLLVFLRENDELITTRRVNYIIRSRLNLEEKIAVIPNFR
jgi:hypothetical protein